MMPVHASTRLALVDKAAGEALVGLGLEPIVHLRFLAVRDERGGVVTSLSGRPTDEAIADLGSAGVTMAQMLRIAADAIDPPAEEPFEG